jgi:hypothetical protein
MTMSISSAPAATVCRVSSILMLVQVWPLGKPVATAAVLMFVPFSAFFTNGTMVG